MKENKLFLPGFTHQYKDNIDLMVNEVIPKISKEGLKVQSFADGYVCRVDLIHDYKLSVCIPPRTNHNLGGTIEIMVIAPSKKFVKLGNYPEIILFPTPSKGGIEKIISHVWRCNKILRDSIGSIY